MPLDTYTPEWYNLAKLSKLANLEKTIVPVVSRTITSTEAQNNFGQILNDVIQNRTRYVIKRRNAPQAILLSLADFEQILLSQNEQGVLVHMIHELTPVYQLGEPIEPPASA